MAMEVPVGSIADCTGLDQANLTVSLTNVIQVFGARNQRMAQDFANLVGGVSAADTYASPRAARESMPDHVSFSYHFNRRANCRMRGSNAELMTMKFPDSRSPVGFIRFGRLNALKASARN